MTGGYNQAKVTLRGCENYFLKLQRIGSPVACRFHPKANLPDRRSWDEPSEQQGVSGSSRKRPPRVEVERHSSRPQQTSPPETVVTLLVLCGGLVGGAHWTPGGTVCSQSLSSDSKSSTFIRENTEKTQLRRAKHDVLQPPPSEGPVQLTVTGPPCGHQRPQFPNTFIREPGWPEGCGAESPPYREGTGTGGHVTFRDGVWQPAARCCGWRRSPGVRTTPGGAPSSRLPLRGMDGARRGLAVTVHSHAALAHKPPGLRAHPNLSQVANSPFQTRPFAPWCAFRACPRSRRQGPRRAVFLPHLSGII